jgi:hypothetical protein
MRTVDIGIGHQHDLIIPELLYVESSPIAVAPMGVIMCGLRRWKVFLSNRRFLDSSGRLALFLWADCAWGNARGRGAPVSAEPACGIAFDDIHLAQMARRAR